MKILSLPKVSVLIPAFNEEKYILLTLEALLKQNYPSYEIIVVDNASTDSTAALIESFVQKHKHCGVPIKLLQESRRGTNFARECARQRATGSVIAQLDADCIPGRNWIRLGVLALCNSGKRIVAVTGPYDYFDGDNRMRRGSLLLQKIFYPLISSLVQIAGSGAILIGGNTFVRAEILARAGGYNTDLTFYGDDVELGKRLARFGHVLYKPSLVQPSSSRRYKANGFFQVNKKYQAFFWALVWNKAHLLHTLENNHPR